MSAEKKTKQKDDQLGRELVNLKHIEWLQQNIDKYKMGKWGELRKNLLEEISFENYDIIKKYYADFIDNFENNPYAYSCPIEENKEKIMSAYPECYFVRIDMKNRTGKQEEYVPIGFLEKFAGQLKTDTDKKENVDFIDIIKKFLDKKEKMFWIHTYSKDRRVYLKNFYECYKDGWETEPQRDQNQMQNFSEVNMFPEVKRLLMVICIWVFLWKVSLFPVFERWQNIFLLLLSSIAILEIDLIIASAVHKYKKHSYREAIKEFEKKESICQQCCEKMEESFSSKEREPLSILIPPDYLSNLEKNMAIRADNGMISKKEFAIIGCVDFVILLFLFFIIL